MDWIRPWLCKHVNRKGVYHMFSRRARPRYRAPFYAAPRGRTAEQAKRASRASDRERERTKSARYRERERPKSAKDLSERTERVLGVKVIGNV